jgi:hypothetical protein
MISDLSFCVRRLQGTNAVAKVFENTQIIFEENNPESPSMHPRDSLKAPPTGSVSHETVDRSKAKQRASRIQPFLTRPHHVYDPEKPNFVKFVISSSRNTVSACPGRATEG